MPTVLRRYAGLIRENGGTGCVTGVADLGTQAACTRVVQEAVEAFGGLDLLCNVVDLLRMHALVDVPSEDLSRLVSAILTAPSFMMQAAISPLIERHGNVETGRASGRERVCQYVLLTGMAVSNTN